MEEYKYKVVNVLDGSCTVPPHTKFYLEYKKGDHVRALRGTLGIMVFSSKMIADGALHSKLPGGSKIKRVIPVGTRTAPGQISLRCQDIAVFNEMTFGERLASLRCTSPPGGTECYPEVFVVD